MRKFKMERKTGETGIALNINLDGSGKLIGSTGIGFFDHMINLLVFHGGFDLEIDATGDLETGSHHLVEDFGITLGKCFLEALKDKRGIERYGLSYMPMDETLVRVVVDLSGRPYLKYDYKFSRGEIGGLALEDVKEFLRGFTNELRGNIHIELLYGENEHHMVEAIFKGLGRSLKMATRNSGNNLPSTKGVL